MTRQEINSIIESKAAEHGFEAEVKPGERLAGIDWTSESYINIQIMENMDPEKTDWGKRLVSMNIEASCSVCKMGGNPTPEELLEAADEIARGARLTAELQRMELSYTEAF